MGIRAVLQHGKKKPPEDPYGPGLPTRPAWRRIGISERWSFTTRAPSPRPEALQETARPRRKAAGFGRQRRQPSPNLPVRGIWGAASVFDVPPATVFEAIIAAPIAAVLVLRNPPKRARGWSGTMTRQPAFFQTDCRRPEEHRQPRQAERGSDTPWARRKAAYRAYPGVCFDERHFLLPMIGAPCCRPSAVKRRSAPWRIMAARPLWANRFCQKACP